MNNIEQLLNNYENMIMTKQRLITRRNEILDSVIKYQLMKWFGFYKIEFEAIDSALDSCELGIEATRSILTGLINEQES